MDSSEGMLIDVEIPDELEARIQAFADEAKLSFDEAVTDLLWRYLDLRED